MTTIPSNIASTPSNNAPASSEKRTVRRAIPALAMLLGLAAFALSSPPMAAASSGSPPHRATSPRTQASRKPAGPPRTIILVQNDNGPANQGVSPDDLGKYVAVYRAMQRNHSITVEQAAAAQGLTLSAFRDLERRVESNDLTRDDARRALAAPAPSATPTTAPKAQR
ncbi:MAG TPA: hypothetical protein VNE82_23080 [Candidatus Binataceae bacterium]|nr:hypothetical protein [Candidatus Binataceae bacterium]